MDRAAADAIAMASMSRPAVVRAPVRSRSACPDYDEYPDLRSRRSASPRWPDASESPRDRWETRSPEVDVVLDSGALINQLLRRTVADRCDPDD